MATIEFIYQTPGRNIFHGEKINELLTLHDPELILFSVAFIRQNGVEIIASKIKELPDPTIFHCYAGIRNGVTSIQGLNELLKLNINLYTIDTSSNSIIFHPKIYISKNSTTAKIIIGSCNLTNSGLYNNIESSFYVQLDLRNPVDNELSYNIINSLKNISVDFPRNVEQISSARQLIQLLRGGRIVDERESTDQLFSSMQSRILNIPNIPSMPVNIPARRSFRTIISPTNRRRLLPHSETITRNGPLWELVWISKPLTERDLNIPSGNNTHSTGSMTLKKGALENIDHRHYFYDYVFSELNWTSNAANPHLLYANASFGIEINGIYYGEFQLELKHDTRTTTRSYLQHNAMTHLKWGAAKSFIANRNLLGKTMLLYKDGTRSSHYLISIRN